MKQPRPRIIVRDRKIPLDGFGDPEDLDTFLVRAMSAMRIRLSGKDYGDPKLQFD